MARRSDHTRDELHALILDAARNIVERKGLAGLTIRALGDSIGYSSGTLYNLFQGLDDIVIHLNAATLDELHDELVAVPKGADVEATLCALADCYAHFTTRRPLLWGLLFQDLPNRSPRPNWYYRRMDRLLTLVEDALAPLFGSDREAEKRDAARVLWSGLHGMCMLAAEGAVVSKREVRRLSTALVTKYVSGLRSSRSVASDAALPRQPRASIP